MKEPKPPRNCDLVFGSKGIKPGVYRHRVFGHFLKNSALLEKQIKLEPAVIPAFVEFYNYLKKEGIYHSRSKFRAGTAGILAGIPALEPIGSIAEKEIAEKLLQKKEKLNKLIQDIFPEAKGDIRRFCLIAHYDPFFNFNWGVDLKTSEVFLLDLNVLNIDLNTCLKIVYWQQLRKRHNGF